MRTDELIQSLAADTRPVSAAAPQWRLAAVAGTGAVFALALVLAWLKLRPDLPGVLASPFVWAKAGYTGLLALAGFWASARLARPGSAAPRAAVLAAGVTTVFAILAVVQFMGLDPDARIPALRGGSWTVCSLNILILGGPTTLLALLVLRGLAPTRPSLAGLAAGLFGGSVGATVYGLHCPESTFVFVALWYTLGIAACALLGAGLGRFLLRW